ncbi:MAG: alpha/beta hydrolase [Patescibacteria group bacterium]|nr:alpha/beta hydrolase [Patescibacteria group bacterium]
MEEKFLQVKGLKIFTRITGKGDPFLILHGWGASSRSWIKIQEKLSENFKVFSLDFPGFGKSDLPPKAWEVQDYVELIIEYAEKIGIQKFYLLGHSFGGRVSIKLTAQLPEKINKLILVDAAGIRVKSGIKIKLMKVAISFLSIFKIVPGFQLGKKIFYKFVLRSTDYLKVRGVMKETFIKVIEEDLMPYLSKISVPSLVIWGRRDRLVPLKDGYLMNKEIKSSELKIFNCDHCPHLETPELLVETILDFLK